MDNIKMTWVAANQIKQIDAGLPILQVYIWIITTDKHIVIVSKDAKHWQFPGGKPEPNEEITGTAIRETTEETSLNLSSYKNKLNCFGYYIVEKDNKLKDNRFIQVRLYCHINKLASDMAMHAGKEDLNQADSEKIKFVRVVTIYEATQLIPWLKSSGEYTTLLKMGNI